MPDDTPQPDDNDTPLSPPAEDDDLDMTSTEGGIDDTHPTTDSNVDPHEAYDEGLAGATEAEDGHMDDKDLMEDIERP